MYSIRDPHNEKDLPRYKEESIMEKKECVAMLLAGGKGTRLEPLTKNIAKPAVSFGGKYRIIDFTLSNCVKSGVDTVGILTQYRPLFLHSYVGTGAAWDLDIPNGGVSILPPYMTGSSMEWYQGTADAIYHNLDYISQYNPDYVLILSGDHLYRMDYSEMLQQHKDTHADLTVSTIQVPWEEASRLGIVVTDRSGKITKFSEKPKTPESNLASMGIYIFSWSFLLQALLRDHQDEQSSHDFGKDIIPSLLNEGCRLFAYEFKGGYWMDIGTLDSYYNASMKLLDPYPEFDLFSVQSGRILSNLNNHSPQYIGAKAKVTDSLVCNGCEVLGQADHSILSINVQVGENATVESSVLLPGVRIGRGSHVQRAIIAENVVIGESVCIGDLNGEITVVGENTPTDQMQEGEH